MMCVAHGIAKGLAAPNAEFLDDGFHREPPAAVAIFLKRVVLERDLVPVGYVRSRVS